MTAMPCTRSLTLLPTQGSLHLVKRAAAVIACVAILPAALLGGALAAACAIAAAA